MRPPDDDEQRIVVPVSALRHYTFCPRRCALQYVEQTWADNRFTIEGDALHERVDTAGYEERPGVRVVRALPIFSDRLGLSGRADVVEFVHGADGRDHPSPVEYKRGARRLHDQADLQLCAQALCLEEMFGVSVDRGSIYFGDSRRRREVAFSPELRERVAVTAGAVRALMREARTPPARHGAWCDGCSLQPACIPTVTEGNDRSAAYLDAVARFAAGAEP